MAGKRMLHSNICESMKLASVSYEAESLYYRLLTRADDNGNFTADPRIVWGNCMALRCDMTPEKVEILLNELATVSNGEKTPLIKFYETEGDRYLHITKFEDFQYLRPDRPASIKHPSHLATLDRSTTGIPMPYLKEVKLKEVKEKETIDAGTFKNIACHFLSFFGFHHSNDRKAQEAYSSACAQYGEEWVLAKFDVWAHDNDWVRVKKAKFALTAFYKTLEQTVAADELTSARKQGAQTDIVALEAARARRDAEIKTMLDKIAEDEKLAQLKGI